MGSEASGRPDREPDRRLANKLLPCPGGHTGNHCERHVNQVACHCAALELAACSARRGRRRDQSPQQVVVAAATPADAFASPRGQRPDESVGWLDGCCLRRMRSGHGQRLGGHKGVGQVANGITIEPNGLMGGLKELTVKVALGRAGLAADRWRAARSSATAHAGSHLRCATCPSVRPARLCSALLDLDWPNSTATELGSDEPTAQRAGRQSAPREANRTGCSRLPPADAAESS